MKIAKVVLLFCLIMTGLFAADTFSDSTITFQGFLTNEKNEPYIGATTMGFRFYSTQTGGDYLVESYIGNVTVFNGNYTVKIPLDTNGGTAQRTALNDLSDIWLEVYVAPIPNETNVFQDANRLDTRIQLTAAPYALSIVNGPKYDNTNDVVLVGYTAGNVTAKGGLLISGRVGIGTTSVSAVNGSLAVQGDVRAEGNVKTNGTVTAGKVYGAVWN